MANEIIRSEVPQPATPKTIAWYEWLGKIAPLITLLGVLGTWFAATRAWQSAVASARSAEVAELNVQASIAYARAELYISLKDRYYEIDTRLQAMSGDYKDEEFRPRRLNADGSANKDWRVIKSYWYHCFDEWYATHKVSNDANRDLWDEYFLPIHLSALEKRSLRGVFLDMCANEKSEFAHGIRHEYAEEIKNAFEKTKHAPLGEL